MDGKREGKGTSGGKLWEGRIRKGRDRGRERVVRRKVMGGRKKGMSGTWGGEGEVEKGYWKGKRRGGDD